MRKWVLGASDPEMVQIEEVLEAGGEDYGYAAINGVRCHSGNVYRADAVASATHWVECWAAAGCTLIAVPIDHHRPGDYGYLRGPEHYLAASSLGQVLEVLEVPAMAHHRLAAASDHCPAAAYRGLCPGIEPLALRAWRLQGRAAFQGRSVEEVEADVTAAIARLDVADPLYLDIYDMRGPIIPELPEALLVAGVAAVAGLLTDRDGRRKYVLLGAGRGTSAGPEAVTWFLEEYCVYEGLVDTYGSPVRGYGGGYVRI